MNKMWTPSENRIKKSQMYLYMNFLHEKYQITVNDYESLHKFSTEKKELFWKTIISFFEIKYEGSLDPVLLEEGFENYSWFSNVKLNIAENFLKSTNGSHVALNFQHESLKNKLITYSELKREVKALQIYLKTLMEKGDVLAAFMPNIPETVVAMLATTSFGGIFTSTSCDFGIDGVLDRFGQSKPKVLITVNSYEYGGKYFDLKDKILEIEKMIPSLEKIIIVDFLKKEKNLLVTSKSIDYADIIKKYISDDQIVFSRLPFSHPLYIMYSSGTTGKPKCIVHSQGGTLLQSVKELGLHVDFTEDKNIFFFTTCGWMMWNWLLGALFHGGTITLYEGSPTMPSPIYFFNLINREKINIFGTSPKFLKALEKEKNNLEEYPSLETLLSTGAPLMPEQYDFVYTSIKKDILLGSISGGTDILSCFMLSVPILPVFRGEIQGKGLGMDIQTLDENGKQIHDKEGELVCVKTFPSRPLYFLNDPDKQKINEAYFNQNKEMWTHGDFVKITKNNGIIVYGRSDATLNPGGVRIGTAEIYRQTENLFFLQDSLCVGRPLAGDVEIILFVKMKENETLTNERKKEIKELIKKSTTPRHVPSEIFAVTDIPYTRSGKKVEIAVMKILAGKNVNNTEALVNPDSLKEYEQFAIYKGALE